MPKKRRTSPIRPDEVISRGPIHIARFGSNIIWQSNWSEGDFAEVQRRAAARFPAVTQEIDGLVARIADLVSVLPPTKVLQRAWYEMATRHVRIDSEADIEWDDSLSLRMIDYVQSMFASVPPAAEQYEGVTEDHWQALKADVDHLFRTINLEYQICRTAWDKAHKPSFNEEAEEFAFKAQLDWCNVRGRRYQFHNPSYTHDVFSPHSDVLIDLFGISASQFIAEITKIGNILTFGIGDAFKDLKQFRKDTLEALEARVTSASSSSSATLPQLMDDVLVEHGWEARRDAVLGRLFGMDLFDLEKNCSLPGALLDELTWLPGEDTSFFADGPFRGWPLRIWPTFKRPFIRLNGRYYCFDSYGLFDNLYRVMERIICRAKPSYRETWNEIQRTLSEELPLRYLQQILPGATVVQSIHYQWRTGSSRQRNWCEVDGLVVYDDHLFVQRG
jgi:hypothetical protein